MKSGHGPIFGCVKMVNAGANSGTKRCYRLPTEKNNVNVQHTKTKNIFVVENLLFHWKTQLQEKEDGISHFILLIHVWNTMEMYMYRKTRKYDKKEPAGTSYDRSVWVEPITAGSNQFRFRNAILQKLSYKALSVREGSQDANGIRSLDRV